MSRVVNIDENGEVVTMTIDDEPATTDELTAYSDDTGIPVAAATLEEAP